MFANVLVVLPKTKAEAFKADQLTIMRDYYEAIDAQEDKRVSDLAKIKL